MRRASAVRLGVTNDRPLAGEGSPLAASNARTVESLLLPILLMFVALWLARGDW
jgi:hypothetical protein